MSAPPNLTVSPSADLTTSPPARGAEMRSFLQARLQKRQTKTTATEDANRAPPLVHSWDFWHDRQDRGSSNNNNNNNNNNTHNPNLPSDNATTTNPSPTPAYEDRLILLASIPDIRAFWSLFNNFDTTLLPLRDSIHLFKRGVKPIWEDPRNATGGAWTFRVPKTLAPQFWQEICMMAVGETLQTAIDQVQIGKSKFRDDVCGVSLGVRFGSMLVQVWNRDGGHEEGVRRVLETVWGNLSEGLKPREGSYYYKKHSEHAAFGAGGEEGKSGVAVVGNGNGNGNGASGMEGEGLA